MTCLIIGSGIVGLSVAKSLIEKDIFKANQIMILDKYSIPSDGTSTHNSGVLHAGLYYKHDSLKAMLSIQGGRKLTKWCEENNLPLLKCGKLLVPFSEIDKRRLEDIYNRAIKNGCDVNLVDYKFAKNIQKGIINKDKYLWSPKTYVFNPKLIIQRLFIWLKNMGVTFQKSNILFDDIDKKNLIAIDGEAFKYSYYFNCAGPGSLGIVKTVSNNYNKLAIVPFMGQYGIQKSGIRITTNLYPVPDPNLPFLGIHITPRISSPVLIGPNAIPSFSKDVQGFDFNDFSNIPNVVINNLMLFFLNKKNFRQHAISEICLNTKLKFLQSSLQFLDLESRKDFSISMDKTTYGIRPQLINTSTFELKDDFIYERINGNIHLVNAVSPAFTSCFALSDYLVEKL